MVVVSTPPRRHTERAANVTAIRVGFTKMVPGDKGTSSEPALVRYSEAVTAGSPKVLARGHRRVPMAMKAALLPLRYGLSSRLLCRDRAFPYNHADNVPDSRQGS